MRWRVVSGNRDTCSSGVTLEAFISVYISYLNEVKLSRSSGVFRYKGQAPDLLGKQDSVYEGKVYFKRRDEMRLMSVCDFTSFVSVCPSAEDWDMLDVDEDEKLTGEEEFELLAGPLGLSERRIVPEAVQFPDSDPLGASIAMVTATNSMEETLLQIGEEDGVFNGVQSKVRQLLRR